MAKAQNSGTRITVVFMLIFFGILAYVIAPIFLPVWGYFNLDFERLSKRLDMPIEELKREYTMVVRYDKRGRGDPAPWQLVYMNPEYTADEFDEYHVAVRVHLISDHTGEPPGTLTMGTTARDHYFKIKGYRFPPGAFGVDSKRPVVVYHGSSKTGLSIPEAEDWHRRIRREFENDDFWPERDDGWVEEPEEPSDEGDEGDDDGWILPE